MLQDYKNNCINYLKKHEEDIKRGFVLEGVNYQESDYDELVKLAYEAYKRKLEKLSKF